MEVNYAKNSKTDGIIALLKSLESENKKLKKENKALRKDKWELEGINEACRKENEAYEGIVEEIEKYLNFIQTDKGEIVWTEVNVVEVLEEIKDLKKKYLGGGE